MPLFSTQLTNETPSESFSAKGVETFLFASGTFDGGSMVAQVSYDNSTWFSDSNLTFSSDSFETLRLSPTLWIRFVMESTDTASPDVEVVIT